MVQPSKYVPWSMLEPTIRNRDISWGYWWVLVNTLMFPNKKHLTTIWIPWQNYFLLFGFYIPKVQNPVEHPNTIQWAFHTVCRCYVCCFKRTQPSSQTVISSANRKTWVVSKQQSIRNRLSLVPTMWWNNPTSTKQFLEDVQKKWDGITQSFPCFPTFLRVTSSHEIPWN